MLKRWFIGVPLLLGVMAIGVTGLRWGMANMEQWRAGGELRTLEKSNALPGPEEHSRLARAHALLDRASRLRGDHPEQFNLRGRLFYWQAVNVAPAGRERSDLLAQAIEHYRQAIAMRPTWPYFWANLTLAKAERGVFDREFRNALQRTIETGPWELRLQQALIRMDFVEGSRIDRRSQERLDGVIRRALDKNPGSVLRLAQTFGQLPRVCALAERPRFASRCAGYWTPVGDTETTGPESPPNG